MLAAWTLAHHDNLYSQMKKYLCQFSNQTLFYQNVGAAIKFKSGFHQTQYKLSRVLRKVYIMMLCLTWCWRKAIYKCNRFTTYKALHTHRLTLEQFSEFISMDGTHTHTCTYDDKTELKQSCRPDPSRHVAFTCILHPTIPVLLPSGLWYHDTLTVGPSRCCISNLLH